MRRQPTRRMFARLLRPVSLARAPPAATSLLRRSPVATPFTRPPLASTRITRATASPSLSQRCHISTVRHRTTIATADGSRQYSSAANPVWAHLSGDLKAKRADFSEVPVIDVAPLVSGQASKQEMDKVVTSLRDACYSIGFFYVTNHGVPASLVDRTLSECRRFFALPVSKKMEISCRGSPNRGYFEMFGENLGEKKIGDYKEGIDIGRVIPPEELSAHHNGAERALQLANKWPTNLPGFKETMDEYYGAMSKLGLQLTRGVALSLGINKHFFDDKLNRAMASLRLLHYPPQTVPVDDENLGCGPHTDYGVMTILAQDVSGLQVRNRQNQWVEVPVIPNAFVVNLGDMTQRWTNDVYVSTPHRAINTTPNQHRYSLPFFYEPNIDARIEVIPECTSAAAPPKYPPIVFSQHLANMYVKTFAAETATSEQLKQS